MIRPRSLLAPALVAAMASFLFVGCGDDPDKTGDPNAGIGAAGTNDPNAAKSQEEARQRQLEEEAAAQKANRKK